MISLIFFSVISLSNAVSFNYSTSSDGRYDTILRNERVLVKDSRGMSQYTFRLTYAYPLHLWDKDSGNLSDFYTYFTFFLDTNNQTNYADGLAFFLAPNGSSIPDNITKGGAFGLTSDERILNSSESPFFAVEFDVYSNPWDPPGTHVGVDIDSMRSVTSTSWLRSVTNEVWISYNSTSHNLSVVFYGKETRNTKYLSYTVDLRSRLPQWVTFGFCASIKDDSLVQVRSWNFSSHLEIDSKTTITRWENDMGKVVGPIAAGCLWVIGLATTWFFLWRKYRRDREYDDLFHQYMGQEFPRNRAKEIFLPRLVKSNK